MSTIFSRGENPLKADKLNSAFAERVSRAGDTMQGMLRLAADPVAAFDAATKQYVDRFTSMGVPAGAYIGAAPPGNVLGPLWWDTNSGQLFIQYDDGSSVQWVSANSIDASTLEGSFLPLTGGTVSGVLHLTEPGHTVMTLTNGINFVADFEGTPWPGIEIQGNPMTFSRAPAATHSNDYVDFQFRRNSTGATGGAGNINSCLQATATIGPNDASDNWNLTSFVQTTGTGLNVALDVGVTRNPGGTGGIIGAVIVAADNTNSNQGAVGLEVDCAAQNADNSLNAAMWGGTGGRVGIDIVAIRNNASITTPRTEVSVGVWFTQSTHLPAGNGDPYINYKSFLGVAMNTQAYQALDTRGAIVPTGYADPFAAVRMQAGQVVDFKGGPNLNSVGGNYLQYATAGIAPRLRYMAGASEVFSITDGGLMSVDSVANQWTNAFVSVGLKIRPAGGSSFAGIAMTDAAGANVVGIVNYNGTLSLSKMPAYGDTATAANSMLNLNMPNSQCYTAMQFAAGISFLTAASGAGDLSKHIALSGTTIGFNSSGGNLNYNMDSGGSHVFYVAGTMQALINSGGFSIIAPTYFSGNIGFFGTAAIPKRTGVAVTAAAIHAALVSYGLIAP